jgi:hypothetical protein
LTYALNIDEVAIDDCEDSICCATITVASRAYKIKIVYPDADKIQFGYKFTQVAIYALQLQGLTSLISDDFCHIQTIHNTLIKRPPLIYKDGMVDLLLPDEKYRMSLLYGSIGEIEELKQIEFIS